MIKYRRFFRTRKPFIMCCNLDKFTGKDTTWFFDEVIYAYDNGERVGQIGRAGGWVYGLSVRSDHRKQGIATELLRRICNDIPENSAWLIGAEKAVGFYRKQEGWVDFGALGEKAGIDYGEPEDHLFGKEMVFDRAFYYTTASIEDQAVFVMKRIRGEVDCETLQSVREFVSSRDSNTPVNVLIQGRRKPRVFNTVTMCHGRDFTLEIDLHKPYDTKSLYEKSN